MPRVVSNKAQLEKLVALMEENEDLARGVCPKNLATDRWAKIARELNSIGPPIRSDDLWQKVWKDLKYKTKKKMSHNRSELIATGGGPNKLITLSGMEEAISRVMQYNTYVQPEGIEFGVGQVQNQGEHSDDMLEEEDSVAPSTSKACKRKNMKRKHTTSERHGKLEMFENVIKNQAEFQIKMLGEMRAMRESVDELVRLNKQILEAKTK